MQQAGKAVMKLLLLTCPGLHPIGQPYGPCCCAPRQDKLREVAVFPGLRALQAELDAAPLPAVVRRAIQAAIPVLPPPRLAAPRVAPRTGAGAPGSGAECARARVWFVSTIPVCPLPRLAARGVTPRSCAGAPGGRPCVNSRIFLLAWRSKWQFRGLPT